MVNIIKKYSSKNLEEPKNHVKIKTYFNSTLPPICISKTDNRDGQNGVVNDFLTHLICSQ